MTGLCLFHSNRQETLASLLADVVTRPLSRPLQPEIIMTQSLGMRKWLSLNLAESLGIAANIDFKFPNQIMGDIFEGLIPDFDPQAKQERELTIWKIMEILPGCLEEKDFKPLKNYLRENEETSQIMSYQLANKIAYLFDQYAMCRAEMTAKWEKGEEKGGWQSELWNLLQQNCSQTNFANFAAQIFKNTAAVKPVGLPERISIFGVNYIPPLYLEILNAVSRHIEVNIFFLNPCREFWLYISSKKEIARALSRDKSDELTEQDLYLEQGNSLLASWGKSGRDFFQLLIKHDYKEVEKYEEPDHTPTKTSMLKSVQSQIFNLLEGGVEQPPEFFHAEDASIRIHSCHSRRREIEVLYDQILLMIDRDPDLKPEDILVMAPDINPYIHLIKSVFKTPVNRAQSVFPFSIADKELLKESEVISYFLKLMDLPSSRFSASQILNLLESEAIRSRFKIFVSDLDLIRDWTRSANACWGINSDHRQKLDTPPIHQNTWEFGLERMLLGLAKPDIDGDLFHGILPLDKIEGSDALILGNFLDFFRKLQSLIQDENCAEQSRLLEADRSLGEWGEYFKNMLDDFFSPDDEWQKEIQLLSDLFNELKELEKKADLNLKVNFEVIKEHITGNLKQMRIEDHFLARGTTFCSMLPMRSIPFKVIALLGMNDQEFPRLNKNFSFDLMLKKPLLGDRNISDEDSYLFLESLLAAKDFLYISYIGQSVQDSSSIPPSSLVNELLYYLEQAFESQEGNPAEHILVKHQLQAFSPNYFKNDESKLSYSEENLDAAKSLLNSKEKEAPVFIRNLPEPEEEWRKVELNRLVEFFSNPAEFLIKRRLGISLETDPDILPTTEPFKLDGLERYKISQTLLEAHLKEENFEAIEQKLEAEGVLPLKGVGKYYFKLFKEKSGLLAETVRSYIKDKKIDPPLKISAQIGKWILSANISSLREGNLIRYRCASITLKDKIRNWLELLLLSYINNKDDNKLAENVFIGFKDIKKNDDVVVLLGEPIQEAEKILLRLLEYYWKGLSEPLPFFAKSSAAYVESLNKSKDDEEKALKAALRTWEGSPDYPGEKYNPYIRKIFGDSNSVLDRSFQEISTAILRPIFESLREKK